MAKRNWQTARRLTLGEFVDNPQSVMEWLEQHGATDLEVSDVDSSLKLCNWSVYQDKVDAMVILHGLKRAAITKHNPKRTKKPGGL